MAFIEVVTRCYKRPEMLMRNAQSISAQTFDDWEQTFLIDEDGIGLDAANAQLADFEPAGDYVWILDDDDMAAADTVFAQVYEVVSQAGPDMVMVKMDHAERGILPVWARTPEPGAVGVSAAFIERELWLRNAHVWNEPGYMTDGKFIRACYDDADYVVWLDIIASRVQRISLGAPE